MLDKRETYFRSSVCLHNESDNKDDFDFKYLESQFDQNSNTK